ncbi:MAG: aspartate-semialdehyde dehydrogenase [Planctomycetota bacterium]|nr:aspartate-semialdehyde dehydrogenase [Planctomycetota bacterium]
MAQTWPRTAVIGATGAVGVEFLRLFEERGVRPAELVLLASPRSAGRRVATVAGEVEVRPLTGDALRGVELALFSAGGSVSREFGPVAVSCGAVVVDNSSAFRMDHGTPLVIPEINPEALAPFAGRTRPGIIANPNCSTIILLMALDPLRRGFGVRRAVVSTYQAVSGAGASAMDELAEQTREVLAGRRPRPSVFHEVCAFNLFSHNSKVDQTTGLNVEEQKMIDETRKIWGDASVEIVPTCVRVPVMRAHAESVTVTLERAASEADVRRVLSEARGVRIVDDRAANRFPTPLAAAGGDDVLVGRIRPDPTQAHAEGRYVGWSLFVCGDQLRKGAALNAVQIAERVVGS